MVDCSFPGKALFVPYMRLTDAYQNVLSTVERVPRQN
ncbi:hypothetical protein THOM_3108 [Trachipleistophora hominis]|uniref:Uncharacterized protein n=1 Tax=Trachipleistophora hominis TaxID=72359 RepID=L7JR67_TRAHO|nr:hypothetical protein THOM_3108 [Trachipleistophora hominis]